MIAYSQADSLPKELSVPDRLGRVMFRGYSRDDDGDSDGRRRYRRGRNDDGNHGGDGRRRYHHERDDDGDGGGRRCQRHELDKDSDEKEAHEGNNEEAVLDSRQRYERRLQQAQPPQAWQRREQ